MLASRVHPRRVRLWVIAADSDSGRHPDGQADLPARQATDRPRSPAQVTTIGHAYARTSTAEAEGVAVGVRQRRGLCTLALNRVPAVKRASCTPRSGFYAKRLGLRRSRPARSPYVEGVSKRLPSTVRRLTALVLRSHDSPENRPTNDKVFRLSEKPRRREGGAMITRARVRHALLLAAVAVLVSSGAAAAASSGTARSRSRRPPAHRDDGAARSSRHRPVRAASGRRSERPGSPVRRRSGANSGALDAGADVADEGRGPAVATVATLGRCGQYVEYEWLLR